MTAASSGIVIPTAHRSRKQVSPSTVLAVAVAVALLASRAMANRRHTATRVLEAIVSEACSHDAQVHSNQTRLCYSMCTTWMPKAKQKHPAADKSKKQHGDSNRRKDPNWPLRPCPLAVPFSKCISS